MDPWHFKANVALHCKTLWCTKKIIFLNNFASFSSDQWGEYNVDSEFQGKSQQRWAKIATQRTGETDTLDWAKLWSQIHTKGMHILQLWRPRGRIFNRKRTPEYQYLALCVYQLKWVLWKVALLFVSWELVPNLALAPSWVQLGHLLKLKCAHSPLNLCILSSTSVPFTLTTVQVSNLSLTHTKRITVWGLGVGVLLCLCDRWSWMSCSELTEAKSKVPDWGIKSTLA